MDDILLIDDDVELCSMLKEYMGRFGFRLTAVHRGDTGLKAAIEKPYALVLLDVMLPGLDGFEVLRRVRAVSRRGREEIRNFRISAKSTELL